MLEREWRYGGVEVESATGTALNARLILESACTGEDLGIRSTSNIIPLLFYSLILTDYPNSSGEMQAAG